jgi:plastocyanin domain-containing protein
MRSGLLKGTLLALAVLAFGAAFVVAADQPDQKGRSMAAKSVAPGQVKKFHVTAVDGKIAPSTIRVNRGDKVQITFVSRDANYSIKFKDFEISEKVSPEKPAVIEFTPTTAGSFEFRCSKSASFKRWSNNGTLVVN